MPEHDLREQRPIIITRYPSPDSGIRFAEAAGVIQGLYVKLWLIQQNRFGDLQRYNKTGDPGLEQECGVRLIPVQAGDHPELTTASLYRARLRIPQDHNPVVAATLIHCLDEMEKDKKSKY